MQRYTVLLQNPAVREKSYRSRRWNALQIQKDKNLQRQWTSSITLQKESCLTGLHVPSRKWARELWCRRTARRPISTGKKYMKIANFFLEINLYVSIIIFIPFHLQRAFTSSWKIINLIWSLRFHGAMRLLSIVAKRSSSFIKSKILLARSNSPGIDGISNASIANSCQLSFIQSKK